jgi:hypothetical protein
MADIYYPPASLQVIENTAENISRMGKRAVKVLYHEQLSDLYVLRYSWAVGKA